MDVFRQIYSTVNSALHAFAPERAILERGRKQQVALAAETAVEFGLREQRADPRFAAGGEQREPVEGAGKRAALYEIGTLAKPAGQLQAWVVVGPHKTEAVAGCAFRRFEGDDRERPEFARQRLFRLAQVGRSKRRCACEDLRFRIGETADLASGPVDIDQKIGRGAVRLA